MEGNCPNCIYWFEGSDKCLAFPEKIPDDIFYGNVAHTMPYEGDAGIMYEPLPVAVGELGND